MSSSSDSTPDHSSDKDYEPPEDNDSSSPPRVGHTAATPPGMRQPAQTGREPPIKKDVRKLLSEISYLEDGCSIDGARTNDAILQLMHTFPRRKGYVTTLLRLGKIVGVPLNVDSISNLALGLPTAHVRQDSRPKVQEGLSLTLADCEALIAELSERFKQPIEERVSLWDAPNTKFPKFPIDLYHQFVRVMCYRNDALVLYFDDDGNYIDDPRIIRPPWPSGAQPDIKALPSHNAHLFVWVAWGNTLCFLRKKNLLRQLNFTDNQKVVNDLTLEAFDEWNLMGPVTAEECTELVEKKYVRNSLHEFWKHRGTKKEVGLYDSDNRLVGPDPRFPKVRPPISPNEDVPPSLDSDAPAPPENDDELDKLLAGDQEDDILFVDLELDEPAAPSTQDQPATPSQDADEASDSDAAVESDERGKQRAQEGREEMRQEMDDEQSHGTVPEGSSKARKRARQSLDSTGSGSVGSSPRSPIRSSKKSKTTLKPPPRIQQIKRNTEPKTPPADDDEGSVR
ncbi:hypothetical protein CYLTODRAFT_492173 [Cylindrobasidium torrendii FP15055 ss-10]|uniref:Uncharacterized protein n=1 Tax=Cylindrobasidium torrendii FP15055 ss-10 TaxID=1314674 RepID=A0A0D7B7U7_9AGAR|nr:hypothetical protein CYLTODRAFT_492173 [Cylindrobasidium torrendii FP15055 ss-10]